MLIFLLACADLPEGFEGATPVPGFEQSACLGTPDPTTASYGTITSITGGVDVWVAELPFRCEQRLEGFMLVEEDNAVSLLIQPIDMDPEDPKECACTYEVTAHIVLTTGMYTMDVFRRGDHSSPNDEPVLVAYGPFEVP